MGLRYHFVVKTYILVYPSEKIKPKLLPENPSNVMCTLTSRAMLFMTRCMHIVQKEQLYVCM